MFFLIYRFQQDWIVTGNPPVNHQVHLAPFLTEQIKSHILLLSCRFAGQLNHAAVTANRLGTHPELPDRCLCELLRPRWTQDFCRAPVKHKQISTGCKWLLQVTFIIFLMLKCWLICPEPFHRNDTLQVECWRLMLQVNLKNHFFSG